MTDATHTRDSELREILAEEIDRRETLHETTHDKASPLDRCFDAAMAALRRISSNQSRHELSEADVKRAFDTLWKSINTHSRQLFSLPSQPPYLSHLAMKWWRRLITRLTPQTFGARKLIFGPWTGLRHE